MNEKDNKFILKNGSVNNKIRLLPTNINDSFYKRVYNIMPNGGGSMGIHQTYLKYYSQILSKETAEEILEKIDIKIIENFLRKKKLEQLLKNDKS